MHTAHVHPRRTLPLLAAAALACLILLLTWARAADSAECGEPERNGDTALGTPCADVIVAGPGVDAVYGRGGDDRIFAASSGTAVSGGGGDDVLLGHAPRAAVDCPDACQLGLGSQTFEGGPGDDTVFGERGNDVLSGGGGNDRLYGGIGDDDVDGQEGADLVSGGWGVDRLDGGAGDDQVRGDGSADRIFDSGGTADTLSFATAVGPGFPARDGPNGYDQSHLGAYPGFPPAGGERGVYLDLAANIADNGEARFGGGWEIQVDGGAFENVIGSPFADYIAGNSAPNVIHGGGGGDVILGREGGDTLHGGAHGDHLEGGDGSDTTDGDAGSDHCTGGSATECEAENSGGVVLRDGMKIGVGILAPFALGHSQAYLLGSSQADQVTAAYDGTTLSFSVGSGSATFDTSGGGSSGCTVTATQATCALPAPLDSIVLFGAGGADGIGATSFPSTTSVVLAGGIGGDILTGGSMSEDVLVDDPTTAPGADTLTGSGRDDALVQNEGADAAQAGEGNDLFISTSVCDGDDLDGGPGRDNGAWPRFQEGVDARLSPGVAGRPGSAAAPSCGAGEQIDSLTAIEDLEGTERGDVLHGDGVANNLLGWAGTDTFEGGAGNDRVFANADDSDASAVCGDGLDRALIDRPPRTDPVAQDCEIVERADPFTFAFTIQPLPEPSFSGTSPPSPANDNTPEITGGAVAGSTVRLYSGAACSVSSLVATGSAEAFSSTGLTVTVPDNSTTTLHAVARTDESASECSTASISYTESTPDVPPTAVDDFVSLPEDSGVTPLDVLGNDPDPDGGEKWIQSAGPAGRGTVGILGAGGAVTYAPPRDWCGATGFPYTLNGGSSARVAVKVDCRPERRRRGTCAGRRATKTATAKRDVLTGTRRRDVIAALGGNDLVRGLGGDDLICGGAGRDTLRGGPGRDALFGGPGLDRLLGGPDTDLVRQG